MRWPACSFVVSEQTVFGEVERPSVVMVTRGTPNANSAWAGFGPARSVGTAQISRFCSQSPSDQR